MTNQKFNEVAAEQIEYCKHLLGIKGNEYDANSDDRLHAFKTAAALLGCTPEQALAGMMAKHTVSIYDMCAEGEHSLDKWTEKITDSINYLLLLKALVVEEIEARSMSETVLAFNDKERDELYKDWRQGKDGF